MRTFLYAKVPLLSTFKIFCVRISDDAVWYLFVVNAVLMGNLKINMLSSLRISKLEFFLFF